VTYCETPGSNEILIMACDVALGDEWHTNRDKYMDHAQPGTHCTHALGRYAPRLDGEVDDGTGCKIPRGMVERVKEVKKSSVNVNEYIVYDVGQVQIRYLLRLTTEPDEVGESKAK
jgi:hypothetical protein